MIFPEQFPQVPQAEAPITGLISDLENPTLRAKGRIPIIWNAKYDIFAQWSIYEGYLDNYDPIIGKYTTIEYIILHTNGAGRGTLTRME